AVAAAVVAVLMMFIGGKLSFEWSNAGSSPPDATSAPKILAKGAKEPEQPAPTEQRTSPATQVASGANGPGPANEAAPASSPVRKAIEAAPVIRGVSENEIRFGISAPFTGPARELGQQMKLGIETAFRLANEAGGVHGRQLSLIAADDGYEPDRT